MAMQPVSAVFCGALFCGVILVNLHFGIEDSIWSSFSVSRRSCFVNERVVAVGGPDPLAQLRKVMLLQGGTSKERTLLEQTVLQTISRPHVDNNISEVMDDFSIGEVVPICFVLKHQHTTYDEVEFVPPQKAHWKLSWRGKVSLYSSCVNIGPDGRIVLFPWKCKSQSLKSSMEIPCNPVRLLLNESFLKVGIHAANFEDLSGLDTLPEFMTAPILSPCGSAIDNWKGYNLAMYHSGDYSSSIAAHDISSGKEIVIPLPTIALGGTNIGSENMGSIFVHKGRLYASVRRVVPYSWASHQGHGYRLGSLLDIQLGPMSNISVAQMADIYQIGDHNGCVQRCGDISRFYEEDPVIVNVTNAFAHCPVIPFMSPVFTNGLDRPALLASLDNRRMHTCFRESASSRAFSDFFQCHASCHNDAQVYHNSASSYHGRLFLVSALVKHNVVKLCTISSGFESHLCFKHEMFRAVDLINGHPLASSIAKIGDHFVVLVPGRTDSNLIIEFWKKTQFCYISESNDIVKEITTVTMKLPSEQLEIYYNAEECTTAELNVVFIEGNFSSATKSATGSGCKIRITVTTSVVRLRIRFMKLTITAIVFI